MKFRFLFLFCAFLIVNPGQTLADPRIDLGTLYKVTMLRAGPGQLEELINYLKAQKADGYYEAIREEPPMIMRHSQGDHWDLFLMQPIGSYERYFGAEMIEARHSAASAISAHQVMINILAVFREELFAYGPPARETRVAFDDNAFYHLELFAALAGEHHGLLDERIRENGFLRDIGNVENFIFVGDMGSDIDVFTIGFYKSLQDYATPSTATAEEQLQAAIDNGFKSDNHIGFNLREFLAYHHDTLARKVQ